MKRTNWRVLTESKIKQKFMGNSNSHNHLSNIFSDPARRTYNTHCNASVSKYILKEVQRVGFRKKMNLKKIRDKIASGKRKPTRRDWGVDKLNVFKEPR